MTDILTTTALTNGTRGPRTGSNSEVADQWAAGERQEMRGNSLSYVGGVAYSYSTPIARHVTNKSGTRAILITTRRYSVTTNGKHLPPIRQAARETGLPVFNVYDESGDTRADHQTNCVAMEDVIRADIVTGLRSRSYKEQCCEVVERRIRELLAYAAFVGLDSHPSADVPLGILWDWFEEHGRPEIGRKGRELFASVGLLAA